MEPSEPSLRDILRVLSEIKAENQVLRSEVTAIQARLTPIPTTTTWNFPGKPILKNPTFQGAAAGSSSQGGSPTIQVVTPSPIPLAPPERFLGDSAKFGVFFNQCHLHFIAKPSAFPDDATKVAFILSYLGGDAALWSVSLVETNHPLLYDFDGFRTELKKLFGRHIFIQGADNELLNRSEERRVGERV